MSSGVLQSLIRCLGYLSVFLFIGMFLRAKVPVFRKLLLPASVIGGFILLLLGPQVLGEHAILKVSEEYLTTWAALPGVLIVPIFASVPLGSGMNEPPKEKGAFRKNLPKILVSCGLFSANGGFQMLLGFGFTLIAMAIMPSLNLYRTFGFELSQGYSGGHGTAAGLGSILEGYGLDYWQTSMGVATTFATIGLVGGMLLGIFFINRASRKGETKILDKPAVIPMNLAQGFDTDVKKQPVMGRETTVSSSIETITVHLGIMLGVSALAYYLLGLAKAYQVPGLTSIPVWFYALLLMYIVNFALKKLKLDWLIDKKVKSRISGAMSDFAIIAAISSMSVKAVMAYAGPIAILAVIGFVTTYFFCFPMYRLCFGKKDFPFERAIMSWGVNTGVMINGMMLLKICDPDYDSPVLEDFSMGFALMSIISIFTSPIMYSLLATGSTLANFGWCCLTTVAYAVMALIGRAMLKKADPGNFEA